MYLPDISDQKWGMGEPCLKTEYILEWLAMQAYDRETIEFQVFIPDKQCTWNEEK